MIYDTLQFCLRYKFSDTERVLDHSRQLGTCTRAGGGKRLEAEGRGRDWSNANGGPMTEGALVVDGILARFMVAV